MCVEVTGRVFVDVRGGRAFDGAVHSSVCVIYAFRGPEIFRSSELCVCAYWQEKYPMLGYLWQWSMVYFLLLA